VRVLLQSKETTAWHKSNAAPATVSNR